MTTISPIICECGRELKSQQSVPMHRTGKQHKEWEDSQVHDGDSVSAPMDETLVAAISSAKRGLDPRDVAKMVRSVFNRMDWPDDSHPGTVVDFLEDHNIPILNVPRGLDPDDARRYTAGELASFKSQGYGTDRWEIKE